MIVIRRFQPQGEFLVCAQQLGLPGIGGAGLGMQLAQVVIEAAYVRARPRGDGPQTLIFVVGVESLPREPFVGRDDPCFL